MVLLCGQLLQIRLQVLNAVLDVGVALSEAAWVLFFLHVGLELLLVVVLQLRQLLLLGLEPLLELIIGSLLGEDVLIALDLLLLNQADLLDRVINLGVELVLLFLLGLFVLILLLEHFALKFGDLRVASHVQGLDLSGVFSRGVQFLLQRVQLVFVVLLLLLRLFEFEVLVGEF